MKIYVCDICGEVIEDKKDLALLIRRRLSHGIKDEVIEAHDSCFDELLSQNNNNENTNA